MIYIWNSICNEVNKNTIGCINRKRTTNKNTAATTILEFLTAIITVTQPNIITTMAAVIVGCCFNKHPQIQITGHSHALYISLFISENTLTFNIFFDTFISITSFQDWSTDDGCKSISQIYPVVWRIMR
jgi:hypothetical protein